MRGAGYLRPAPSQQHSMWGVAGVGKDLLLHFSFSHPHRLGGGGLLLQKGKA